MFIENIQVTIKLQYIENIQVVFGYMLKLKNIYILKTKP